MKNYLIILFLTISSNIFGFTLNITSSVNDLNNNPINNHWVYIESIDSSFFYIDSTSTDINGSYSFIANNVPSQNTSFIIYTFDCNNTMQNRFVFTTNSTTTPFSICSNNPTPSCNAQFFYYSDSLNPNTYYFINQSNNFTSSTWEINGQFVSNQTNLTYTFLNNPSINNVCLTINDSINMCSDSTCSTVVVNNCNISFTSTINGFSVDFIVSGSTQFISYNWNFGDGNTQTTSSPIINHIYGSSGTYLVQLVAISIYNQAQDTCFAYASDSIYIGNPSNTGNIYGYVFADSNYLYDGNLELYGKEPATQKMILLDSTQFILDSISYSSYFIFENKAFGDYYIKCNINNSSYFYGSFFDSWYPNTINWQNAQEIELSSSIAAANIILVKPEIFFSGGIGSIEGSIIAEQGINATTTKVYLYKDINYLVGESKLNTNGGFSFDSLIYGNYTLKPELINYNSTSRQITITQESPEHSNVNIGLNSNGFYVGNNAITRTINELKIYPNPAKNKVNILINSKINDEAIITISNLLGSIIYQESAIIGRNTIIEIPISEINLGVYIITISTSYNQISKKFIKQ